MKRNDLFLRGLLLAVPMALPVGGLTAQDAAAMLAHEAACKRRAQDRLDSYLCPPSAEQPITVKVNV